ncbi:MAG: hypothetical protein A2138_03465 [Deltaproteobacteria bacterium RBG_16_71_12]|nr:MAG: hypothetical protein A2138_03465 [Deltaproteobacteria bacterium RBG_16_71_12]
MRLGIFGRLDDPLSVHTEQASRARGHDVVRLSLSAMLDGTPGAFDGKEWLFAGHDVGSCDAFVLRQYPAAHALLAPSETTHTAADWFRRGMQQQERSAFAQSLLLDLELMGKPMVNRLGATQAYDHKPLQLAVLERLGVPLPRTLVTNFPEAARLFVADVGDAICKPLAGGAETRAVDDELLARLDRITTAPAIFQERIGGPDVRVTVVGERVISSVAIESSTLDYRSGAAYQSGGARYLPHPLPAEVEALCVRVAAALGQTLSGIDLKHAGGGRGSHGYVLLEANSAPVYLDIEQKTGAPITDSILDWLEAAAVRR